MEKRGFTLIELSVVIGLIGLLLLIAFPTWNDFRERLDLEGSAAQLASDLRRTQVEALALDETRCLTFNGKQFAFSKTGNPPPGGSGTAVIAGRRSSRLVVVSSAGRVRIE